MKNKVIQLENMNKILNHDFIYDNVGWGNHGEPPTEFNTKNINTWVMFDVNTDKIKQLIFNSVIVWGCHGFGGTTFDFTFKLNGETFKCDYPTFPFAENVDTLKEDLIKKTKFEIKQSREFQEKRKEFLDTIEKLN